MSAVIDAIDAELGEVTAHHAALAKRIDELGELRKYAERVLGNGASPDLAPPVAPPARKRRTAKPKAASPAARESNVRRGEQTRRRITELVREALQGLARRGVLRAVPRRSEDSPLRWAMPVAS